MASIGDGKQPASVITPASSPYIYTNPADEVGCMVPWQMWLVLAAMLYIGRLAAVGCLMGEFAASALAAGGLALFEPELEAQVRCFLCVALACILWTRTRGGKACRGRIGAFLLEEFAPLRRILAGHTRDGGPDMASNLIREFTEDHFDTEVLQQQGMVVVDFWAEWCGPCRRLAPIIEELAEEYAGKITVGKLNVDGAQRLAGRYGILSIPTLAFFVDGKPVDRLVGLHSKDVIKQKIEELGA